MNSSEAYSAKPVFAVDNAHAKHGAIVPFDGENGWQSIDSIEIRRQRQFR